MKQILFSYAELQLQIRQYSYYNHVLGRLTTDKTDNIDYNKQTIVTVTIHLFIDILFLENYTIWNKISDELYANGECNVSTKICLYTENKRLYVDFITEVGRYFNTNFKRAFEKVELYD